MRDPPLLTEITLGALLMTTSIQNHTSEESYASQQIIKSSQFSNFTTQLVNQGFSPRRSVIAAVHKNLSLWQSPLGFVQRQEAHLVIKINSIGTSSRSSMIFLSLESCHSQEASRRC